MNNKITQVKKHLLFLSFLLLVGYNSIGQVQIENQPFTSGGLPTGWEQTSITFTSYARFTSINSVLTSPVYDLSNYINVTLSMSVAKFGSVTGNGPLTVQVSNDGGSTWTAQTFNSGTPTSSTYVDTVDAPITVTGSNVRIRFVRTNSPSEKRLQNYILKGEFAPTGPTITYDDSGISSFGNQNILTYSASQSFTVSGFNLTDDIVVTAPTANYEISLDNSSWSNTVSIAPSSGSVTDVPVYVRFYPQTSGTILNDIDLSTAGATTSEGVTVVGNGVVPQLGTPIATAATSITATSFTANWNAVSGATNYAIDVSTSPTFTASNGFTTDLIISEYVEGSSNNKYIEIFNGTGADVDLSDYAISVYPNGATAPGTTSSLSGTLPSGSTIVYKNSGAIIYTGTATNLGATNYNGDDAVALVKLGNNIDVIGVIGDPSNFAANVTLTRNSSVFAPTTTYTTSQWTSSATDNVSNLGSHAFDGGLTPSFVAGYENVPVGNNTTFNVINLTQGTTYYYRVRATGTNTSENSNVIQVTTDFTSVIWDGIAWNNVTGPTNTIEAVIEGVYSTDANGSFSAKNIVVNSGSLTINSNTAIVIEDDLVNNLAAAAVVIENNGILKQVNDVANTGNITVKRNSTDIIRLDYTAWSSPVAGQNLFDFTPQTVTNRFYEYDPTANAYIVVSNIITGVSGANFTGGKGYLLRAPNNWSSNVLSAYPGIFTGVPNNGDYTPTVGNWPSNPDASSKGFNLLGNPYASPIDANLFLNNVNNSALGMTTLYFWTHKHPYNSLSGSYGTNNYATYNTTGGSPANVGEVTPDGIIQVGQGFLVDATANGSAAFNNTMRLSTSNGQFFKTTGELNQPITIEKHRMWLGLTSPNSNHNVALIGYVQGATNAVDSNFDAKLFDQASSILYSPINNSKYVIQGRSLPFDVTDVVPLGLVAQTAGQYTIVMTNFDGLFTGQDIFLRDNLLNVTHDIKGSSYTFASDAGEFNSRFEIVYASPLAVVTPTFTENSVVVYNNETGITINAGQTTIDNVKVFDVRGRLLVSKSKVNASSITIENVATEKQVLIVQITSTNNLTISKKVIN